jgi:hypothetical protein
MTHVDDRSARLQIRQRMNSTGIGYAGIDGVWWLPAVEPFVLPASAADELVCIGRAVFDLFDAVAALYGTAAGATCGLNRLLEHNVPAAIPRWFVPGAVLAVRPDFQLQVCPEGQACRFVATELEIAPSAQGFAHAMQVGYGLPTDLAAGMAKLLRGRSLLFAGTAQWSEFLFEQLAFCRALAAYGERGYVLLDRPIAQIAAEVRAGQRWAPPLFGLPTRPANWDDDVLGRVERQGLTPYLWPEDANWPERVGDAVVFRFGYFDSFAPATLHRFAQWQAQGAIFLNPLQFMLDSKVILAAALLPGVRQHLAERSPQAVATLADALPETRLLEEALLPQLFDEQEAWIIKFAGYDGGNQAWGGRSLQIGAELAPAAWREAVRTACHLPWPVVAQRMTPSVRVDLAYFDDAGEVSWLRQGSTRLRSFFMRNPEELGHVQVGGTHITVVADGVKVAESVMAVQVPVVFRG